MLVVICIYIMIIIYITYIGVGGDMYSENIEDTVNKLWGEELLNLTHDDNESNNNNVYTYNSNNKNDADNNIKSTRLKDMEFRTGKYYK